MTLAVSWDYFDRFTDIIDGYLLPRGEGDTMATQIVTAVNKLIYMFYNNGDIFDNYSRHHLYGCNDISSYANWLLEYAGCDVLRDVYACDNDSDYSILLKDLADETLNDEFLADYQTEKHGSIYECEGEFSLEYYEDEEDEEDWW